MCKKTNYKKTSNTRIDKCLRIFLKNLSIALKPNIRILAGFTITKIKEVTHKVDYAKKDADKK